MKKKILSFTTILAAIFAQVEAGSSNGVFQVPDNLLTYGITGSETGNYSLAMSQLAVQKLLLDIATTPRKADFLDAALKGTETSRDALEDLRLVRRQGDTYVINFVLLTSADEHRVSEVAERRARLLATAFLARRKEIEAALGQYQVRGIDSSEMAYIVLGCFSLDWDGLDITAEKGYRSVAKPLSNGDQFTPWAREKSGQTYKGLYKGSHNRYLPDVVITSFGDQFSLPRNALPDLTMRVPSRSVQGDVPMSLRPKLGGFIQQALDEELGRAGRMMLALREGEKAIDDLAKAAGVTPSKAANIVALLAEINYVGQQDGRYHALIPVLTGRDRSMIQQLLRIGRQVMDEWLSSNYDRLKEELAEITPVRYGVPFTITFTEIWHYIFGATNRQLVEAGLFADPYSESRKFKGFIPVVWEPSLNRLEPR